MIYGRIVVNQTECCHIDSYGLNYDPPITGQMSVFAWVDQQALEDTTATPADAVLEVVDDEGPTVLGSETFFDFQLLSSSNPAEVTFTCSGVQSSF